MRLETTKDIIVQSKRFHKVLANFYHDLNSNSDKARFKILLEYLEEREKNLENTLSELELTTSSKVLNNWFTHSGCSEKFKHLSKLITEGTPMIDDVINMFIEIDDCLIGLYQSLADSSGNNEVADFFKNLVKLEENHKIKAIKNAAQINDF